ncbi:hypothetical protein EJ04DRAFT_437140 [Polyplosphaeria fusca]|uniref:Nucleotide-diphospho-sugar transferase domain-containing protein n=1 Tax=Polyplosphaeria fusca TaxID=682080 RepID=A0A9P4QVF1_9PLEO|nr:hypothetical protein EJ04DRAFT_437140 [Polyplosphaeria fusca]
MLSSAGARSPLFALAVTAGIVLIFIFGFLTWQTPVKLPFPHTSTHVGTTAGHGTQGSVGDALRLLFAPIRVPPSQKELADETGKKFSLPEKTRYNKELGKKILILDLETRELESTKAYNEGHYDWRKINHVSGGIFNHYAYAMVHGYDYKFIHAAEFEDRHGTWIKPSALANNINDYDFIVFLDADATFRYMHLPIEWLLNHWEIEPKHAITMALDPWDPESPQYNSDAKNRTYTNTGFMVVQNTDKTQEILKAWHECPDDTRYKDCSQWKKPKFHEQSAFGEFIRYDYGQYIKELPCAEANGYPGVSVAHCEGLFIRHYWFEKQHVKNIFMENVMQTITLSIQKLFAENDPNTVYNQSKNEILVH